MSESFGRLLRSYRKDAPKPDEQLSLSAEPDAKLEGGEQLPAQQGAP